MTYALHIAVCIVLLLFQTVLKPQIAPLVGLYDLLLAYMTYLGLRYRVRKALPLVLAAGFAMDSLSGGPFGLFLTTYLWLILLIRGIKRFVHPTSLAFRLLAVPLAVILQNLIYAGVALLLGQGQLLSTYTLRMGMIQLTWALATGGVLLTVFHWLHVSWERLLDTYLVREPG
jgi:hypothetical protein